MFTEEIESKFGLLAFHLFLQALVNQVAATIYARFHRKKLPTGKAVYGVFTRDYQYNTLNSQVIVVMLITSLLHTGRHPFPSSLYVLPEEVWVVCIWGCQVISLTQTKIELIQLLG